jgi:hypothetical protein
VRNPRHALGPEERRLCRPRQGPLRKRPRPVRPRLREPPILSSVAPVPTQSYAPARSEGPGGISVYAVKPAASAAAVDVKSVAAPVAPVVTPAPDASKANDGKKIISTTTYTSAGVVYEVAIEEVMVTVTVTEDGAYKKARRHAHVKAHARRNAERV